MQDALAGKVVISMANALAMVGSEFQPLVPPRGSVAASVQAKVEAHLRCLGCGRYVMLPRTELARRIKRVLAAGAPTQPTTGDQT